MAGTRAAAALLLASLPAAAAEVSWSGYYTQQPAEAFTLSQMEAGCAFLGCDGFHAIRLIIPEPVTYMAPVVPVVPQLPPPPVFQPPVVVIPNLPPPPPPSDPGWQQPVEPNPNPPTVGDPPSLPPTINPLPVNPPVLPPCNPWTPGTPESPGSPVPESGTSSLLIAGLLGLAGKLRGWR